MRKIRCFYWQIVGNLLYWIVVRYAADIGLIFEDISCWMHHRKMETTKRKGFCELLMCPEFCSVFLYRLRDGNNKIIFHLSKLILKEEKTLFITTPKIGGGVIYYAWFCHNYFGKSNRQELHDISAGYLGAYR